MLSGFRGCFLHHGACAQREWRAADGVTPPNNIVAGASDRETLYDGVVCCADKLVLAVAFAGKLGSGKTTVTRSLAGTLGWPRAGFGDYVREAVRRQGLEQNRENLQRIGSQLLDSGPETFCTSVLRSCGWKAGQNLIIDGLRHVETIEIIRKVVYPAALKIVFISVPESTRLERLLQRGERDVTSAERHSSEQQVASAVYACADLVVEGNKPVESIVAELTAWITNL